MNLCFLCLSIDVPCRYLYPLCQCMYMCEWGILCMSLNIYVSACVCVCVAVSVFVDAYSVLLCSCTGTQETPALMEAEAVVAVLIAQTCRLLL